MKLPRIELGLIAQLLTFVAATASATAVATASAIVIDPKVNASATVSTSAAATASVTIVIDPKINANATVSTSAAATASASASAAATASASASASVASASTAIATNRVFANPHCAICSYMNGKEYKFYGALKPNTNTSYTDVLEFAQDLGSVWTGHRLCCDFDPPSNEFDIIDSFNMTIPIKTKKTNKKIVDSIHQQTMLHKRQNKVVTMSEYVNKDPACIAATSNNPFSNPYHPLLTPKNAEYRTILGFPVIYYNSTMKCAEGGNPCKLEWSEQMTVSQSFAFSITDGSSGTYTNSFGQTSSNTKEESSSKEISNALQISKEVSKSTSQGGNIGTSFSDSLTKTTELQLGISTTKTNEISEGNTKTHDVGVVKRRDKSRSSEKRWDTTNIESWDHTDSSTTSTSDTQTWDSTSTSNWENSNTKSQDSGFTSGMTIDESDAQTIGMDIGSSTTQEKSTHNEWSKSNTVEGNAGFSFGPFQAGGSASHTWGDSGGSSESNSKTSSVNMNTSHQKTLSTGKSFGVSSNIGSSSTSSNGGSSSSSKGGSREQSKSRTSSDSRGGSHQRSQGGSDSETYSEGVDESISNSVALSLTKSHSESDTVDTRKSDSISNALTYTTNEDKNWNIADTSSEGNSKTSTFGSTNSYSNAKTMSDEISKSEALTKSVDKQLTNTIDTSVSQTFGFNFEVPPGKEMVAAILHRVTAVQTSWRCLGKNDTFFSDTAIVDGVDWAKQAVKLLIDREGAETYFEISSDQLRARTDVHGSADGNGNSFTSNGQITIEDGVRTPLKTFFQTSQYEAVLTSFGNLFIRSKGSKSFLWQTDTNVRRAGDVISTGNTPSRGGAVRLVINELGHLVIEVDKMFTKMGYSPFNVTIMNPLDGQTIFEDYVTIWSTVPKHLPAQVGIKRNAYVLVLEEFKKGTSSSDVDLVLYDGGGSIIWCARNLRCTHPNPQGYRFPQDYFIPTDFPTNSSSLKPDVNYPHNTLPLDIVYKENTTFPSEYRQERCEHILKSGEGIQSSNRRFKLILSPSGNLIYKDGVRTMWETNTANIDIISPNPPYFLRLSSQGFLYIVDSWDTLLWRTISNNNIKKASKLEINDNGELRVVSANGTLFTSFDITNVDFGKPKNSGFFYYASRVPYCNSLCKECLPMRPNPIFTLHSNGSTYTPYVDSVSYMDRWCSPSLEYCVHQHGRHLVMNRTGYELDTIRRHPIIDLNPNNTMMLSMDRSGILQYFNTSNTTETSWKSHTVPTGLPNFVGRISDNGMITIKDSNDKLIWSRNWVNVGIPKDSKYHNIVFTPNGKCINNNGTLGDCNNDWLFLRNRFRNKKDTSMCLSHDGKKVFVDHCPQSKNWDVNEFIMSDGLCMSTSASAGVAGASAGVAGASAGVHNVVLANCTGTLTESIQFSINDNDTVPSDLEYERIYSLGKNKCIYSENQGIYQGDCDDNNNKFWAHDRGKLRLKRSPWMCMDAGNGLMLRRCNIAGSWYFDTETMSLRSDDKCVDDFGGSNLSLHPCNGLGNQWYSTNEQQQIPLGLQYTRIYSLGKKKCIYNEDYVVAQGDCDDNSNKFWALERGNLRSQKRPWMCMLIESGNRLTVIQCHHSGKVWKFDSMHLMSDGLCVDDFGGSDLFLHSCNTNGNQWYDTTEKNAFPVGLEYKRIYQNRYGRCIYSENNRIYQGACDDNNNKFWAYDQGKLRLKRSPWMCMDAGNGLVLKHCNDAQTFQIHNDANTIEYKGRCLVANDARDQELTLNTCDNLNGSASYSFYDNSVPKDIVFKPLRNIMAEKVYLETLSGTGYARNAVKQSFAFDNGMIRLENNPTYCLDKGNDNTVKTRSCNVVSKWIINDHYGFMEIKYNENLCLDLWTSITNDGNKIWLYRCNATPAQRWLWGEYRTPSDELVESTENNIWYSGYCIKNFCFTPEGKFTRNGGYYGTIDPKGAPGPYRMVAANGYIDVVDKTGKSYDRFGPGTGKAFFRATADNKMCTGSDVRGVTFCFV